MTTRKTEPLTVREVAQAAGLPYYLIKQIIAGLGDRITFELREEDGEVDRGTSVYTLPDPTLVLLHPLAVIISPLRKIYWRAYLPEAEVTAQGRTIEEAVRTFRETLLETYVFLGELPNHDPKKWAILDQLILRGEKKLR
jgi:hypothetical protein